MKVAPVRASYFATLADEIGGTDVNNIAEKDMADHPNISNNEGEM